MEQELRTLIVNFEKHCAVTNERLGNIEKTLGRLEKSTMENMKAINQGKGGGKILLWAIGALGAIVGLWKTINWQ